MKEDTAEQKPPMRKDLTITGGVVNDEHARGRVFCWRSTDSGYALTFNRRPSSDTRAWPFSESPDQSPDTIIVPAGGSSRVFTVRSSASSGRGYGYEVNPKPTGPRPGPEVIPDP